MKYQYPLAMFLFLIMSSTAFYAQSNLTAGDIAITTVNTSENNHTFSFITFVDIKKNSTIKLTDHGWDIPTNGFGSAQEGTITWTATGDVSALTEVIIMDPSGQISSNIGSVTKSGDFDLSSARGDQIIVYQDNGTTTPNFIYMFNRGSDILPDDNDRGVRTSRTLTMLPPGLVMGVHVFSSTSDVRNWQYRCDGPQSGNKESLLSVFIPPSNYITSNATTYTAGALSQNGCSFAFSNVDTSKPIINSQLFTLREDAPNGYAIGVPDVDDASNSQFENWRIVGGDSKNKFTIDPDTGMILVKDRSTFDFETIEGQRHIIYVMVDDASGNSSESSVDNGRGRITIDIEDYTGVVSIGAAAATVQEGDVGVFNFFVSKASLSPIVLSIVNYAGLAAFGLDYKDGLNTITIPANSTSVSMSLRTIVDGEKEPEENVFIATILQEESDDLSISGSGAAQFIIEDQGDGLSVVNRNLSKALKLYPNPTTTGTVYLAANDKDQLQYAELYTVSGKLIKTVSIRSLGLQQLNFNNVAKGVYMLKVYGGNATAVKKLFIGQE